MAPIVAVRLNEEMDVNRANVAQLNNFEVINECGDEYTNVNIVLINDQLDKAYEESQLISIWFWITVGMFAFEVCALISIFMASCCDCIDNDHHDEDY